MSSDASDAAHHVEAFVLSRSPVDAWPIVQKEIARLPRTTIVEQSAVYLHAESASPLFGLIDDLEVHLRATENLVAVRSASRVGYADFGVNRRRIERLRSALRKRGVIR